MISLALPGVSLISAVGDESPADFVAVQESGEAEELFSKNCASCHGQDGRGSIGVPDLTNGVWQYGGSPRQIMESILNGRSGLMPGLGIPLGEEGTDQVVAYVLSLSGRSTANTEAHSAGRQQFEIYCASCHGLDGAGTKAIGAPNLTDDIWIHGADSSTIRDVIRNGRYAVMPSHAATLDGNSIVALTVYLLEMEDRKFLMLSETQAEADTPPTELVQ